LLTNGRKANQEPERKQHIGFAMIDRQVAQILTVAINLKLDQLSSAQQRRAMEREVLDTIEIAGLLCNQRSQAELVRNIKQLLPGFFGFEEVGVMFRDVKSDLIFTMNELTKDEQEEWIKEEYRERGMNMNHVISEEDEKDIQLLLD